MLKNSIIFSKNKKLKKKKSLGIKYIVLKSLFFATIKSELLIQFTFYFFYILLFLGFYIFQCFKN